MELEKNFNDKVANSPAIKDLKEGQKEIKVALEEEKKSNETRFERLENKVNSLETEMKNGFKGLGLKIDNLAEIVATNKTQTLEKKLENTEKALDRKNSNGDKVRNGSIITLLGTVVYFAFDKFGTLLAG